MTWRSSREGGLVAFGFFLARRGLMALLGLALTISCVVGFGGLAIFLGHRGKLDSLAGVPLLASSALSFGVGVLVAFAISTRVFRRDEDEGVRALLDARGVSATAYLGARVAGLGASLAILVGGGTAVVGLLALLAARHGVTALHTAQATLAGVAFGLAFAFTFAPVAMATLGARSRGGGYLALLSVLVLPDVFAPSLGRWVSPHWLEVCSIPGALFTLRTSLAPVGVDLDMLGRAVASLSVIILFALLIVRAELASVRRGPGAGPRA